MKGVGASSRIFELLDREPRIKTTSISKPYETDVLVGKPISNARGVIKFEHGFSHLESTNIQFNLPTQRDLWSKSSMTSRLKFSRGQISPSLDPQVAESLQ